ncbi:MAG: DNA repair protein RecO [Pseudomonadota bacterium]
MEWQDEGLVLGVRNHGETSAIVELMTLAHGRHMGLVRGGRSRKLRPVLQPGNSLNIEWRARLEEHLGMFTLEPQNLRAGELMQSQIGIYGIQLIGSHLRLLPERDPHPGLYRAAMVLIENLEHREIAASLMIRFELVLLEELGFGLDLERCASTGNTDHLIHVSPKSGRAVSKLAGEPWADKLLPLPQFLNRHAASWGRVPESQDLQNGFKLCGFFLERHIYGPRGLKQSNERAGFIKHATKLQDKGNEDE